jgi:sulfite reductase beta subunit-like hemoprotein
MQRIRIFGGRISWPQWRRIAQLASIHSPGFPLHLTTRQDIELHNIQENDLSFVHQGLSEVALTTFGAGGDSVRNITVCAGCEWDSGGFDVMPLAQLVRQHLEQQTVIFDLPRKFKISFSGCERACAKPWLNDLGFIAQSEGLFTVIGAASLGPRPALGVQLYKDLPARHILPLCIAAIRFFKRCGNRENRRSARFRHVREKLGDETFKAELDVRFSQEMARQSWPDVSPTPSNKDRKMLCRLQLPNGNINAGQAGRLADAAEPTGAVVRVNLEHGLELYGTEPIQLPEKLAAHTTNPIVIACPGSVTCSRGLTNCWTAADRIRQAFADQNLPDVRISISGCANNCAHSAVADIGLVGIKRQKDREKTQCYRLFRGGGNGRTNELAKPLAIVSPQQVPGKIKELLQERSVKNTNSTRNICDESGGVV